MATMPSNERMADYKYGGSSWIIRIDVLKRMGASYWYLFLYCSLISSYPPAKLVWLEIDEVHAMATFTGV